LDYNLPKVVQSLAEFISLLNSKGVVHGDLRPANILHVSQDAVQVQNFGCSFQIDEVDKVAHPKPPPEVVDRPNDLLKTY
jgi:tRNA A-37 threonylcarbamoyl transferase component Bud32